MLKESKEYYEKLVDGLEQLFLQDKWGESDTVQPTIRSVSERHLNAVNTSIFEASLKIKSLSTKKKTSYLEQRPHRSCQPIEATPNFIYASSHFKTEHSSQRRSD